MTDVEVNAGNIHDVYIHRNYLPGARAYLGSPASEPISTKFHYWSQPAYCMYTANDDDDNPYRAQNVVVDDNVFGRGVSDKCGVYGPVASWVSNVRGNVFTNNHYVDGADVSHN